MDYAALWAAVWPYVTASVAIASALDASLPQPAPGSHWLILRKLISFVAFNIGNASNGGQPSFVTWIVRIATPVLQAQGMVPKAAGPTPQPQPQGIAGDIAGRVSIKFALLAPLMVLGVLAAGACSTGSTAPTTSAPALTQVQLDARTAHRELVLARLAIDTAAGAIQAKGLSPAVVADVKMGAHAVAGGIETQVASLRSGGSISSQALGAMGGALSGAVPNLGALLKAAHGSNATPLEVAMAAGMGAMQDAPEALALLANMLDETWYPTPDVLQADADALTAAAARIDTVTPASP